MDMKKLTNPWEKTEGFSCPGCCQTNDKGLKMEFWEDGDDVVSYYHPDVQHQSWTDTLHGGIHCLMLDEIAGWVICTKLHTMGVTSKMETKYLKPIRISGGPVEIRARIQRQMRQVAFIEAELWQAGEICTTSIVTYFCTTPEKVKEQYGIDL